MKNTFKRILASSFAYTQLFRYVFKRHITILSFHRVLPDHLRYSYDCPENIIIYESQFDRLMKFLAEHFDVVPVEALYKTDRNFAGKPKVVLTFDDGWWDTAHCALPILQRYGVTASLFVNTGYVGTNKVFWWRMLEEVLAHERIPSEIIEHLKQDEVSASLVHRIGNVVMGKERIRLLSQLVAHMKSYSPELIAELSEEITPFFKGTTFDKMMSWDDIQLWQSSGMGLGLQYSPDHLQSNLNSVNISQLRTALAERCEQAILPGVSHSQALTICSDEIKKLGLKFSLSSQFGLVTSDKYMLNALPRVNVSAHSVPTPNLLLFKMIRALV